MASPFQYLNLSRELACEFLGMFARAEYALKASGFVRGDETSAHPDWDRFARSVDAIFAPQAHAALGTAVEYLLDQPPKKQVLIDGQVHWKDVPPDNSLSRAERVLQMVRRVRNNLFHGGKFLQGENNGGDRDRLLVEYSLIVLDACLPLHEGVAAAYGY